jgi:hypothetical protein
LAREVELGGGGDGYGVPARKNPRRRWSAALFLAGQGLDDVADEEGVTLRRGAASWPACTPAGSCAPAHGRVAVLGRHAGRPGLLGAAYGPRGEAKETRMRGSLAEAPTRPYTGGIGGRRVARPATTSMARESLGCLFLFHLRRLKKCITP